MSSCNIHLSANSLEIYKISILDMSLKITYSQLEPNLSGANELKQYRVKFQYVIGHLIIRSRKVWKAWWDQVLKCSYHFVIWLAHWQQCCQAASQFSAQLDNSKSRSFETSWDHKTSYQILKQGPGCFNSASRKIRTSWNYMRWVGAVLIQNYT